MDDFRPAVFVCLWLFGVLATGPSFADVFSTPSEARQAVEIDWSNAQLYEIVLTEFDFEPSRIVLQHGVPYTLRLENKGRFRHTFTAPEFFHAAVFRPDGMATEAEQSSGSFSLAAGEVEEVDLVPSEMGTYALECTQTLHGLFGMTGDIVVQ